MSAAKNNLKIFFFPAIDLEGFIFHPTFVNVVWGKTGYLIVIVTLAEGLTMCSHGRKCEYLRPSIL